MMSDTATARPVVVIVGVGFGGLNAARALASAAVDVVLLDRNNYHLFQPLLYQVATAGLEPEAIASPVRAILRRQGNVDFRMTDVTGVDLAGKRVLTSSGPVPYDALILAPGAETNTFGKEGVARYGLCLKDLDDAVRARNHVLSRFELATHEPDTERRSALLTFAIVGGGPTGVELAGALSELVRVVLARDCPKLNPKDVRILLLEAGDRLLPAMPARLSEAAATTLRKKHVDVRYGASVLDFDGGVVALRSGEAIPARTLLWAAGARAAPLVGRLGLATGALGRVVIGPTLQVAGHPDVFVVGDAACLADDGPPLPLMAPVAIQMGRLAGANVVRWLERAPLQFFRYRDPGALATIGRNAAVAQIGGVSVSGFVAWLVWLFVHLIQLIGFRNKLLVLINWAWDYLLYDRAIRLITRSPLAPGRGDGPEGSG